MQITLNHASELLNVSYRVVRRRVSAASLEPIRREGRKAYFESSEALPVALALSDEDGQLDLSQERAALAKIQREKCALEVDRLRNILQPRAELVEEFGQAVSEYRAKMLSLPTRMVNAIESEDSLPAKEAAARELIYEALNALAEAGDDGKSEQYRSPKNQG